MKMPLPLTFQHCYRCC